MGDKTFSYWDGKLGPDGDAAPRSGCDETPDWYRDMVDKFEKERQSHLYTRAILTDLIADLCDRAPHYGPATMFVLQSMADRAEARLREVDDE